MKVKLFNGPGKSSTIELPSGKEIVVTEIIPAGDYLDLSAELINQLLMTEDSIGFVFPGTDKVIPSELKGTPAYFGLNILLSQNQRLDFPDWIDPNQE